MDSKPTETMAEIGIDLSSVDEHQVYLNLVNACEEAYRKREKYKKIAPIFVILSGIAYLALIFGLDSKIQFLILWVVTDLYTIALMVRVEYKFHKYMELLGQTDIGEAADDTEEEMEKETEGDE